jgi:hypothetical protein
VRRCSPDGLEERGLAAQEKDANQDQQYEVHRERSTMETRRSDVVIGQEHDLDVEQQEHRQSEERQPRQTVQKSAHDHAAMGPGHRLREEEGMQLEAQQVRATVGQFERPDGLIECQRLARKEHELRQDAEMEEDGENWGEKEEPSLFDVDLEDG